MFCQVSEHAQLYELVSEECGSAAAALPLVRFEGLCLFCDLLVVPAVLGMHADEESMMYIYRSTYMGVHSVRGHRS